MALRCKSCNKTIAKKKFTLLKKHRCPGCGGFELDYIPDLIDDSAYDFIETVFDFFDDVDDPMEETYGEPIPPSIIEDSQIYSTLEPVENRSHLRYSEPEPVEDRSSHSRSSEPAEDHSSYNSDNYSSSSSDSCDCGSSGSDD